MRKAVSKAEKMAYLPVVAMAVRMVVAKADVMDLRMAAVMADHSVN